MNNGNYEHVQNITCGGLTQQRLNHEDGLNYVFSIYEGFVNRLSNRVFSKQGNRITSHDDSDSITQTAAALTNAYLSNKKEIDSVVSEPNNNPLYY